MNHGLQGLQYPDKVKDYETQSKQVGYDNVTYEKEAIMEALLMGKKLGLKLEDLDKSLQYHVWNMRKKNMDILEDLEMLKNAELDVYEREKIKDRVTDKVNKRLNTSYTSYVDAIQHFTNMLKDYPHMGDLKRKVVDRAIQIWDEKSQQKKFSNHCIKKVKE